MRQEKKTVREFNQEFTNVLMDLDPRSSEEMLIWYYKTVVRWEFAETLDERKPVSVKEVMIRSEEKEQKKKVHKAAYERRWVEPKTVEATTPMDIGKERVTCEYYGKLNHTASVCRKKATGIKIASRKELVKEGHCFKCGKQGHIARMCNVKKVAVVSKENKNTSTYSSLKKRERKKKSKESPQTQEPVLVGNAPTVSQLISIEERWNGDTIKTILHEKTYILPNARAGLVCDEVWVNRQDPVIISFVAPTPTSPLTDNSTPNLSFRKIANDERTGTQ
jgi:hypothetical protein